jgi:uncharacterized RDD family membrane protein YckC
MENEQPTLQTESNQQTYAGFWWRFLAYLIDSLILSFVSWILLIPLLAIFGISIYSIQESGMDIEENPALIGSLVFIYVLIIMVSIAVNWLYFALLESSKLQGTVGKMALRIKVTDYAGNRINFARATGRYFGKILSSMVLMIGYIMAGFTERKQALHDILARCYVIKE